MTPLGHKLLDGVQLVLLRLLFLLGGLGIALDWLVDWEASELVEVDGGLELLEGANLPQLHVFFAMLGILNCLDSELLGLAHLALEGHLAADFRLALLQLLH